jgi:hypothetical protein
VADHPRTEYRSLVSSMLRTWASLVIFGVDLDGESVGRAVPLLSNHTFSSSLYGR